MNPINRTSLNTNLEQRYQTAPRLGGDVGTAKFVGTDKATTNFINGTAWPMRNMGWDIHSINFNRGAAVPGFTQAAFNYSKDVLKHNNTNYYG